MARAHKEISGWEELTYLMTRDANPSEDDERDAIVLRNSGGDRRSNRRALHPRLPRGLPHRPPVSVERTAREFPAAQGGEGNDDRLRGIVQSAPLGTSCDDQVFGGQVR